MAEALRSTIEKSTKIDNGPPIRYQLQLKRDNLDKKKDEESKLRKFTYGECEHKYLKKTILLVGATGSGKSTLVNVLVNYVMGVEFTDRLWFEAVSDESPGTESQTSAVSVYEVFGFEGTVVPYSLTIIDTPGYGHTEGIENDEMIIKLLQDLFCLPGVVDTVNAVGLVMKATENRLDERTAYIFNSVTSLFGKDMEQNIVIMITHSSGRKAKDALKALKDAKILCATQKNEPVYFQFDNCQKQTIEDDSDDDEAAKQAFMKSSKGMKKFTTFLETTKPQSLKATVEVMKERIRLTACIQNLKERVKELEMKQTAITKNKEELSRYKQQMEENKDFTVEIDVTYKEPEPINAWWDNKAVTCKKCEENCHHPGCTWVWSPNWCEVMKDGKCTSCSGKCPVEDHEKDKFRYVTKTKTITQTLNEMQKKYKKNKDMTETVTTLLQALENEKSQLQQAKVKCLDEAFDLLEKLEKIALNVDSVSTCVHLEFLIEKMENGDDEKLQKLTRMRDQMSKKIKAATKYFSKLSLKS
ncbi:hypothetical protein WMY93_010612 [Mugilogobius chulae]|uniref:AIG1-type G domain-containing protein n=1 Tax=Mugilogobius chulae TaxID=88201 RepID=A0AAW0P7Z1_9GOBI